MPTIALFWADGQRTLADVIDCVELETGIRAPEYIARYFEIWERLGAIEWKRQKERYKMELEHSEM
jgi:hypothetical protein